MPSVRWVSGWLRIDHHAVKAALEDLAAIEVDGFPVLHLGDDGTATLHFGEGTYGWVSMSLLEGIGAVKVTAARGHACRLLTALRTWAYTSSYGQDCFAASKTIAEDLGYGDDGDAVVRQHWLIARRAGWLESTTDQKQRPDGLWSTVHRRPGRVDSHTRGRVGSTTRGRVGSTTRIEPERTDPLRTTTPRAENPHVGGTDERTRTRAESRAWAKRVRDEADRGRALIRKYRGDDGLGELLDAIRTLWPDNPHAVTDALAAIGIAWRLLDAELALTVEGGDEVGLDAVLDRLDAGTVKRPSVLGAVFALGAAEAFGGNDDIDIARTVVEAALEDVFGWDRTASPAARMAS
jgi:hypothetical protein